LDGRDAILEVEIGMGEGGRVRREGVADVERDARVAFAAVPKAPVAVNAEERGGNLIGRRFEFLQADDVRALARDPFVDLRFTRPDAVNVPSGEFQNLACAA
jgi:hypothetical protein